MLASLSRFFDSCLKPAASENQAQQQRRLQLASAALLMELACADHDFSTEERQTLEQILRETQQLTPQELQQLWQLAEEEKAQATSLYQFTALFNEHYDYAAKLQLLSNLWRVAYADGRLDRYEEHTIRKVADLLYISHKDFIQTKQAVRLRTGS
jgi:uncharacterized tellurite resistance protein B-like protein